MQLEIAMNHKTEHLELEENKNTKQVLVPSTQVSNAIDPKNKVVLDNNSNEIMLNNLSSFEKKLIFEVQARELLWNTNLPLELRSEKIITLQWEKIKNILEGK